MQTARGDTFDASFIAFLSPFQISRYLRSPDPLPALSLAYSLRDGRERVVLGVAIDRGTAPNRPRTKRRSLILNRKKPAALTSPGKVGFLVALLLVVTALGVSYFITGTFGLQWSWIELAGASPTQWKFDLGAFLEEMVPLIALVALLAFASYVLVAGAVRRYQSSVSSGTEYRELLRSFKNADDFDDENRLDELKQHPELREFVMGFKNRMAARERQLEEREKRQKEGPSRAPAASSERGNGNLASESTILLNAIVESKNGFSDALSLTIPELKQIERAVRERLGKPAPVTDDGGAAKRELESLKASVDTTLAAVRNTVATARRDAGSCVTGAREIEGHLASLQQAIDALAVPATASNGVAAAAKRVDAVAESLSTLGEETKRIAIAAALAASGGGEGDAIKVAEEIRTIATRFNAVAQQWREASPAIRSAIDTIASSTVGAEKRRAVAVKTLESVVAKTRLWGERLVALAESVNGLDRATGGNPKPVAAAAPAAPAAPATEDWGNLAASLEEDSAAHAPRAHAHPVSEPDVAIEDDFVPQRAASVFEDSDSAHDDAPFADIPGFEKEKHLFADESGRKAEHHEHETDPRFVVEREAGGEWDLTRGTQAAETAGVVDASHEAPKAPKAKAPAPAPAPAQPTNEEDGFLTGPGPKQAPAAKPAAAKPSKPGRRIKVDDIAVATAPAPVEADADAVELYALGAVDYVAGVHA